MCGIAGYIGYSPQYKERVANTLSLMRNRGPDDQSYWSCEDGHLQVGLLHSRLSIIDLNERSNQPFTLDECTLVFNGEIYNYLELRAELEGRGIRFTTTSDTEVLLHSYLEYGEECVRHFEGMWAFAIYDRRAGKLFLSRDRFAEKPLYLLTTADGLYFGSEVKFLRALSGCPLTVNRRQVLRYLVNGYKSLYKQDETFFEEVQEVRFATNVTIGPNLVPRFVRYWQPTCTPRQMSLNEAIDGFRHSLMESVKIRLRADVPLAFCLSGGVDSSALVSIAAKVFNYDVATFSIIDSDERYNEYDNIKATIDDTGCKHTLIEIPQAETFTRLARLVQYHDAPVYTISYYIHAFLSEAISRAGYRVAFSGTSADEMVTGYYDHFNLHLYEMRNRPDYLQYLQDWKDGIGKVVRNPYLQQPELFLEQPDFRDHIYLNRDIFRDFLCVEFDEAFFEVDFGTCSLLHKRMLNELFYEATPVILHEDDLNSMCYSVENRSPYLDTRLFQFAYSIPPEFLIRNGYGKFILREAVKGILNDKVRLDRQKKGFNASIHSLIDLGDPQAREFLLADGPIFELLDRQKIANFLNHDGSMPNSFSKFLFSFLSAKLFLEEHH